MAITHIQILQPSKYMLNVAPLAAHALLHSLALGLLGLLVVLQSRCCGPPNTGCM